jgi:hypothetical protein
MIGVPLQACPVVKTTCDDREVNVISRGIGFQPVGQKVFPAQE